MKKWTSVGGMVVLILVVSVVWVTVAALAAIDWGSLPWGLIALGLLVAGGLWLFLSNAGSGGWGSGRDPVPAAMAERDAAVESVRAQGAVLMQQLHQREVSKAKAGVERAKARTEELEGRWV